MVSSQSLWQSATMWTRVKTSGPDIRSGMRSVLGSIITPTSNISSLILSLETTAMTVHFSTQTSILITMSIITTPWYFFYRVTTKKLFLLKMQFFCGHPVMFVMSWLTNVVIRTSRGRLLQLWSTRMISLLTMSRTLTPTSTLLVVTSLPTLTSCSTAGWTPPTTSSTWLRSGKHSMVVTGCILRLVSETL